MPAPNRAATGSNTRPARDEPHEPEHAGASQRAQVREVHRELDECLNQWLRGLAPASPAEGSLAVTLYVHAATVEDLTLHSLLRQVAPLYESDWAGGGPA